MIKIDKEASIHRVFATLGASNHANSERAENDYYATDPKAIELLLPLESFSENIWECACGEGHLSKALIQNGFHVRSTDLIDRGYGEGGVDFLKSTDSFDGDIITNPPYKYALEFVKHAIETIQDGHKVAMLLRVLFLEGKARRKLFDQYPPKTVYISTSRILCVKNGVFDKKRCADGSAQAYAWFIWEKPYSGPTEVKWFN